MYSLPTGQGLDPINTDYCNSRVSRPQLKSTVPFQVRTYYPEVLYIAIF